MPSRRFALSLGLILAAIGGQAVAADLHVPAAHPTVRAALQRAGEGDRVLLAPGVYREYGLEIPPGVTIEGSRTAPESVVLDGGGQGRVLRAESLDAPAAIIGLTITGGHATGRNAYDGSGGGLLVSRSDVRLEAVRVIGNRAAASGGGLRVVGGEVILADCELTDNAAAAGGGGLDTSYRATSDVRRTEFAGNSAAWGGAVSTRSESSTIIRGSRIVDNEAMAEPGLGGGLAADHGAAAVVEQTVIADNVSRHGGGVFTGAEATGWFTSVTVDRNAADSGGDGFYGSGSDVRVARSIVSFHTGSAFSLVDGSQTAVTQSNVYGNGDNRVPGTSSGNLGVDPLYCGVRDRGLQAASPCNSRQSPFGLVGALDVACGATTDAPAAPATLNVDAQPNPFNPRTEIQLSVPRDGRVRVSVYDIRGQRVAALLDEQRTAGDHRVPWEARDDQGRALASGTYLLAIDAGGERATTKLMLVR